MKKGNGLISLASWSLLVFATAAIGALASRGAADFYQGLQLPAWAPPASVFGPVWTVLYVLMAVAAWLVWRTGAEDRRAALALFVVQLALNALWSWLFFGFHLGGLALANIVVLLVMIFSALVAFWRIRALAGAMLVPYLLWVSFAAMLNLVAWRLNPQLLAG
jgi:tryptophan-rich sensory protein